MKKYNYILRSLCFIVICCSPTLLKAQANTTESASSYGFYAYFNSLMGVNSTTNPELIIKNNASFTSTGVQLTPASTTQFGGLLIEGETFKSINGLHVEFEYEMNSGSQYDGSYGDGLGFFLYDGSVTNPTLGANGAGLGYCYNRANNTYSTSRKAGLDGGYLGIFLDQFGNNKGRRYQGDSRVNGIDYSWGSNATSHVTLRGAKGAAITTSPTLPVGYTGYPVLVTRSTSATSGVIGKILQSDRSYLNITSPLSSTFSLRASSGGYRKVYLDLVPHVVSGTTTNGFDVKVAIKTSTNGTPITVIDWFQYPTSVPYTENAMPAANGDNDTSGSNTPDGTNKSMTLNAAVPSTIKLGFAASTGAASQQHLIRNVKLTLPYAAEAYDDVVQTCPGTPVSIPVLANDLAYKGVISITTAPTSGNNNTYIDYSMFSFTKSSPTDLTVYRSKTTNEGFWSYNTATGIVTFYPNANFVTKGKATITYTIKGFNRTDSGGNIVEPYGDIAYRSTEATITVNLQTSGCIYCVKSNRMVTQGLK